MQTNWQPTASIEQLRQRGDVNRRHSSILCRATGDGSGHASDEPRDRD